jgi:hypothetical protein
VHGDRDPTPRADAVTRDHPKPGHTAGSQLHQLRSVALRNPAFAVTYLCQRLDDRCLDRPTRAELQILLAETLHRDGALVAALHAVEQATDTLTDHPAVDWPRLITVLAVSADLTVCTGHSDAVIACHNYRDALHSSGGYAGPRHRLLAQALQAVAVYHQDCRQGPALLAAAHRTVPAGPTATMIRTAAAAMRDRCAGGRHHLCGPYPPTPGGLLAPDLDLPHAGYLAHRVWRPPMTHRCPPHG